MQQPLLSICICAIQERIGLLGDLMRRLHNQMDACNAHELVEVLVELDNKETPTGTKRQRLLERAKGVYHAAIDEDDYVYDWYIEEMIRACKSGCDCVGMTGIMTTNGSKKIEWRISKDYDNVTIKENNVPIYLRHTNHLSPVKTLIALQVGFPPKYNAEDGAYSNGLKGKLKTEYKIQREMYHYRFSTKNKSYK